MISLLLLTYHGSAAADRGIIDRLELLVLASRRQVDTGRIIHIAGCDSSCCIRRLLLHFIGRPVDTGKRSLCSLRVVPATLA